MFFLILFVFFFFFNDTATTEIYTLSLHDALPISSCSAYLMSAADSLVMPSTCALSNCTGDRKSTRLNSSHGYISYAVFCLKKKHDHAHSAGDGASRGVYNLRCREADRTPSIFCPR